MNHMLEDVPYAPWNQKDQEEKHCDDCGEELSIFDKDEEGYIYKCKNCGII